MIETDSKWIGGRSRRELFVSRALLFGGGGAFALLPNQVARKEKMLMAGGSSQGLAFLTDSHFLVRLVTRIRHNRNSQDLKGYQYCKN